MSTNQFDQIKKTRLISSLKQTKGNRTAAAKHLGVSVRTVRNWIQKFNVARKFPPQHGRQQK